MGEYGSRALAVEHGADATARDKDGTTLLHHASRSGRVDLARLLVEHGADATTQDKDGMTLLHHASRSGSVELVHMLVEHGAEVTTKAKSQGQDNSAASGVTNGVFECRAVSRESRRIRRRRVSPG
jgi:ankyrin repeat protein